MSNTEHSLPDMIAEAEREVTMRDRVYPGMVNKGRMSNAAANRQISLMRAIRDFLKAADEAGRPQSQ